MRSNALQAGKAYHALTLNFPENMDGDIWVLTLPDNYAGFYLFRDWEIDGTSIRETSDLLFNKPLENNIKVICQFNMMNPDDRFGVEWVDESTIKVAIGQYGTWFWRMAIGAGNYSTDEYSVIFKDYHYLLKINKPDPRRLYIYQDGHNWKKLEPYASN